MRGRSSLCLALVVASAASLLTACPTGPAEALWTDPDSDLDWQVLPAEDYVDQADASLLCDGLELAGFDDWRLPTISELRTLVLGCEGTAAGGTCPVTDDCLTGDCQTDSCYGCETGDGPADGCFGPAALEEGCFHLWSGSRVEGSVGRAWAVGFSAAFVYKPRTSYAFHARCVR